MPANQANRQQIMPPKHVPRKQGLFHLKEEKLDDLTDKITTIKPKLNINQ